jgi:uncharacterized protein YjaZ
MASRISNDNLRKEHNMSQKTLQIVSAYYGMMTYVQKARSTPETNLEQLWRKYVIEPYWADWAAGQFHEQRTRIEMSQPITDIQGLEAELELLAQSGIEQIVEQAYAEITNVLPSPLSSRVICIYALNPQNFTVREKQHGVLGTCVGDNILLQINPMGDNWKLWVPYVLAHEYHHTVWGYNYFAVQGNTQIDLLTMMLTEGQADAFAGMLYPDLHPAWIDSLAPDQEVEQWKYIQDRITGNDSMRYYQGVMFGDEKSGVPWCTGYTIAFHIIRAYLQSHADTTIVELMNQEAQRILAKSGYNPTYGGVI